MRFITTLIIALIVYSNLRGSVIICNDSVQQCYLIKFHNSFGEIVPICGDDLILSEGWTLEEDCNHPEYNVAEIKDEYLIIDGDTIAKALQKGNNKAYSVVYSTVKRPWNTGVDVTYNKAKVSGNKIEIENNHIGSFNHTTTASVVYYFKLNTR